MFPAKASPIALLVTQRDTRALKIWKREREGASVRFPMCPSGQLGWGGVGTARFGCRMQHPSGAPKCGQHPDPWDPHVGQGKLRVWMIKRRKRRKMKDPHQTVPGPEPGFAREGGGQGTR